ncbi:MAG: hypothetical protein AAB588_02370 [Patescibacteria group bacterium]
MEVLSHPEVDLRSLNEKVGTPVSKFMHSIKIMVRNALLLGHLIMPLTPIACGSEASPLDPQEEASGAVPDIYPVDELEDSEMSVIGRSEIGTRVIEGTRNMIYDDVFYGEPSGWRPGLPRGSYEFLFLSERGLGERGPSDGKTRLYLQNLNTRKIRVLRTQVSWQRSGEIGFGPCWSHDGKEIFIGEHGKILAVNADTGEERRISLPYGNDLFITFLHVSPDGDKFLGVEEGHGEDGKDYHRGLFVMNVDGTGYRRIYTLDLEKEFYMDRPQFVDNNTIFFLTRGLTADGQRDYNGIFNHPFLISLKEEEEMPHNIEEWQAYRLPLECSHSNANPDGTRIVCGQEGYIIDRQGNIIHDYRGILGSHATFVDNENVIFTQQYDWPEDSPYSGKIVIVNIRTGTITVIVDHENSYDGGTTHHSQPNAHASPDGAFIVYVADWAVNVRNLMEVRYVEIRPTELYFPKWIDQAEVTPHQTSR